MNSERAVAVLAKEFARLGEGANLAASRMNGFRARLKNEAMKLSIEQRRQLVYDCLRCERRRQKALARSRRNVETLKKEGRCR